MSSSKKLIFVLLALAVILSSFLGGVFFGYSNRPEVEKVSELFNKEVGKPADFDFSPFWRAWNVVDEKFMATNGIEDKERVWGAIQGMVKSLGDPYSVFFPPEEAKMFEEDIKGDFSGVGMEIGVRDGILTVIAPLKDTPAEGAGIKSGDKILEIDGAMTTDMTADEAARLIRGPSGTAVILTILREGEKEPIEIEIIRDTIKIPVLETESVGDGIFVIKLYNFSANSPSEFRLALREFALSGNNKLIIDLRNNPGGFLEAAVDISSWFLPVGKIVAVEKFASGEENTYRSKGYDVFKDLHMVILVNRGTASASEILAGALKEHGIATLVGETTFGKGSVQELVNITPETSLKITIARWLTPNGNSISKEGLEPNVKIEIEKDDIEAGRDPQFEKAVEILKNQ